MLRNRKKSKFYGLEVIKELDSFPKVNKEDFVEKSQLGGIVSVFTYLVILWIITYEVSYYLDTNVDFTFSPDTVYDAKLVLNLDMIVAMPCTDIGADILDSTSQSMANFGSLKQEDTWFKMTQKQQRHFNDIRYINSYLREEFHAINDLLWKSGQTFLYKDFPKWEGRPNHRPDACRLYGSLTLNKVAGNLHITAGKSLSLPDGHIHISAFTSPNTYNFSHRIYHLSFGDSRLGIINPLDGDEKITDLNMVLYQYFIEVVPTDVKTFLSTATTYQYSVQDNMRVIDHDKGSHGIAGIFFKYDVSALKVTVSDCQEPLFSFFIRLSSTIAGIFITAGLLKDLVQWISRLLRKSILKDQESQITKVNLNNTFGETKCDVIVTKNEPLVI